MRRHLTAIFVLSAVAALVFGRGLSLAVLSPDEAMVGYWARVLVSGSGEAITHHPCHVRLLGRTVPLLFNYYCGPWDFYAAVPFVALIHDPVLSLMLHSLAWAVAAVAGAYAAALMITGSALLAALCGLVLATLQPMAAMAKEGVVMGGVPVVALSVWALAFLVRAADGSAACWLGSCALAGLGIGFAPQGLAVLAGWAVCAVLLRRDLRGALARRPILLAALSACALSIGALPLVAANLLYSWFGAGLAAENLARTSAGVENARYLEHLLERLREVCGLLGYPLRRAGAPRVWLWPALLAAAAGVQAAAALSALRRGAALPKRALLPLAMWTCILLLSPLTLASIHRRHVAALLPLSILVIACAPASLGNDRRARGLAAVVATAFVGGLAVDAWSLRLYWSAIDRTGTLFLPADNDGLLAADWLRARRATRVLVVSHDLYGPLSYALQGQAVVANLAGHRTAPRSATQASAASWLSGGDGYVVLEEDAALARVVLLEAARDLGLAVRLERIFERSRPQPRWLAYSVSSAYLYSNSHQVDRHTVGSGRRAKPGSKRVPSGSQRRDS